mgnify:CR=1 FL=1
MKKTLGGPQRVLSMCKLTMHGSLSLLLLPIHTTHFNLLYILTKLWSMAFQTLSMCKLLSLIEIVASSFPSLIDYEYINIYKTYCIYWFPWYGYPRNVTFQHSWIFNKHNICSHVNHSFKTQNFAFMCLLIYFSLVCHGIYGS